MDPIAVIGVIVAAVAVAAAGFMLGRARGAGGTAATADRGAANAPLRRLEEYDFYPFGEDESGHVAFDPDAFDRAVAHFLDERNPRAAGELIVIGEQNFVRDTFPTDRLERYGALYEVYDGDGVVSNNDAYLENYRRIVKQIGRSFPGTGIEILLHNLVNPSRSLVAIENAVVTGRSVGSGATNLVLDLKTRRQRGEDKVNYELNIGARQFKCTTIPIFRPDYGLVGAICINIDSRFLREYVAASEDRLTAFLDNLLRTDFQLDENILSRDEYLNALNGKRRLAAILFSDIVGYTSLMGRDEAGTMQIVEADERIHRAAIGRHRGSLVKKLGDGMLAAFDAASDALAAAREVQHDVVADGRFQVRIGIHLGEVIQSSGDVHGDGVNIAARIQAEMGPGEIGVSSVVYENVRNKGGVVARPLGSLTLKGVTDPVTVYALEV
jgi:class 3 adenylate cyclase